MNAKEQIIVLLFNFIYGFIIYFVSILNYRLIKNETLILKIMITFLFLVDFTFIYLAIIYKLNYGMFHIYYIIMFILGYILSINVKKRVNKTIFSLKSIDTSKKK